MDVKAKIRLSSFQIILLGFAAVIFIGAFLLSLPISSKSGEWTSLIDSLFTSTSAVCVTGLVVFDTATHWTIFGQIIILILIQIGGMGIVTVAISFALLSGKKIGLFSRGTMKEAISAPSVGGIVRLVGFIIKGIFVIELIGTLIMLPIFCKDYGVEGIWMAIFHSVSAFCNAGIDIIAENISELSRIPIRLYKNKELNKFYIPISFMVDPASIYIEKLLSIEKSISYYITPFYQYYGIVQHQNYTFILGPTAQFPLSKVHARELMFLLGIDESKRESYYSMLNSVTHMPLQLFLHLLCLLNYYIYQKTLQLNGWSELARKIMLRLYIQIPVSLM